MRQTRYQISGEQGADDRADDHDPSQYQNRLSRVLQETFLHFLRLLLLDGPRHVNFDLDARLDAGKRRREMTDADDAVGEIEIEAARYQRVKATRCYHRTMPLSQIRDDIVAIAPRQPARRLPEEPNEIRAQRHRRNEWLSGERWGRGIHFAARRALVDVRVHVARIPRPDLLPQDRRKHGLLAFLACRTLESDICTEVRRTSFPWREETNYRARVNLPN